MRCRTLGSSPSRKPSSRWSAWPATAARAARRSSGRAVTPSPRSSVRAPASAASASALPRRSD
eukprot:scaffold5084_cov81-Isochrysis_galbana.AAC.4